MRIYGKVEIKKDRILLVVSGFLTRSLTIAV